MEILTLVWTFFKIGIISFGGGWTVVGIIKREVLAQGWLSEQTFSDVVAIAQVTPGPVALNAATLVGFRVSGLLGAIAASLSVVTFPMLAIVLVLLLIRRTRIDEKKMSDAIKVATVPLIADDARVARRGPRARVARLGDRRRELRALALHEDRPHPDDPRLGRGRSGHHRARGLRRPPDRCSRRWGALSGAFFRGRGANSRPACSSHRMTRSTTVKKIMLFALAAWRSP